MNKHKKKANRGLKSVGEDRISELPDEIIIHILSFLPSTKSCVKTSVLSKRWHNLWTCVPNLIFSQSHFSRFVFDEVDCLKRVVNKTLALHSFSKLNSFSIQVPDLRQLYPSIELWLQLAVKRAVESLTLDFLDIPRSPSDRPSAGYLLPQFVYSNSHMQILTTKFCEFVPHGRISWSALKKLSIRQSLLNDEVIQNILNGTPALENLQLIFCCGVKLLDLSSKPKLKKLVIKVNEYCLMGSDYNYELKIVGPYLETLKILGLWGLFKCKLMKMSSLMGATLDFGVFNDGDESQVRRQNMAKELLENVLHAEQLKLKNHCTEALSKLRMDVLVSLSSNLKSLDVDCHGRSYLRGIERVLCCAHKLEKLVIFFNYSRSSTSEPDDYGKNYWRNAEIPSCLDSHLKTIVISGELRSRVVLEFLQFLLMNSNILEKMIVQNCFNHQTPLRLAEKLSRYPRSSQQALFLVDPK
ncbi:F-box/LRR-repeat protein At5g02910-like isoform X2 [Mercurialis annua]|uniref:F-box/LRR-repeat protein At5g02910-like isoform X2 n=1 Tax=Mercurialis annua TaxID=3986 RepID=UPI00215EDD4E|nr:F-box/LRR-repeat protein At5g02910-like isoform X2 [Mercurialis annua]